MRRNAAEKRRKLPAQIAELMDLMRNAAHRLTIVIIFYYLYAKILQYGQCLDALFSFLST